MELAAKERQERKDAMDAEKRFQEGQKHLAHIEKDIRL